MKRETSTADSCFTLSMRPFYCTTTGCPKARPGAGPIAYSDGAKGRFWCAKCSRWSDYVLALTGVDA